MSIRLMSQAWGLDLGHADQAVLLALADHADDYGWHVFPSVPYIAWKTGYSTNQARRIIHHLAELGVLVPVAHQEGGRGLATEYRLDFLKAPKKVAFGEKPPILESLPSANEKATILEEKPTIAMVAQPPLEPSLESSATTPPIIPLFPENYPAWAEGFHRIEGLSPQTLEDLVRIGQSCPAPPDIGYVLAFVDWWAHHGSKTKRISWVARWQNWLKNEHKVLPFSDKPKPDRYAEFPPLQAGKVRATPENW